MEFHESPNTINSHIYEAIDCFSLKLWEAHMGSSIDVSKITKIIGQLITKIIDNKWNLTLLSELQITEHD